MAPPAAAFYSSPNVLAPYYSEFRVGERLLFTGHSHQAWPDRAREGVERAWRDAAELLDRKWERAAERASRVRAGFARLLGDSPDGICLGTSTHELFVRWLSALPLRERSCVVTTTSEFHSARRQLERLEEEGVRVKWVDAKPSATVGERLAAVIDDRVAAAVVSSVFFDSGELAGGLDAVARACDEHGAELLVDAYHHLNVVPFSLSGLGLERAFVTGGGYKYCQLGEGNCFLRSPPDCALRPVVTGWFAAFDELEAGARGKVSYGPLDVRFAGATYDPTSHYRAAEVFDFFAEHELSVELLREINQHQVHLLSGEIDALGLPESLLTQSRIPLAHRGGFLALTSSHAPELQRELARRGVFTDARGSILRLGPAPYTSDAQIRDAVVALGEAARALR